MWISLRSYCCKLVSPALLLLISLDEILTIFFCNIQNVVPESRGYFADLSTNTWCCFPYILKGHCWISDDAGLRVRCTVGISRSKSFQLCHLWSDRALSMPLIQTKRAVGWYFLSLVIVWYVMRVPSERSMSDTTILGCCAIIRQSLIRSSISAGVSCFSGFCGVTNHQTTSSSSPFIADKLMCTCPSCGGLNEPPKRPMRIFFQRLESSKCGLVNIFNVLRSLSWNV